MNDITTNKFQTVAQQQKQQKVYYLTYSHFSDEVCDTNIDLQNLGIHECIY